MFTPLRSVAVFLLTLAFAAPALAQQPAKDKPVWPEPLPMGVPYYYQPGNNYWYAVAAPTYPPGQIFFPPYAPPGTYYTAYPAMRPVIELRPSGPVEVCVPTAPVVVGPTWQLTKVQTGACMTTYPFGASGPVFGRYSWDYTGINNGFGWSGEHLPHYPYSFQFPTLTGRIWMGFGW